VTVSRVNITREKILGGAATERFKRLQFLCAHAADVQRFGRQLFQEALNCVNARQLTFPGAFEFRVARSNAGLSWPLIAAQERPGPIRNVKVCLLPQWGKGQFVPICCTPGGKPSLEGSFGESAALGLAVVGNFYALLQIGR